MDPARAPQPAGQQPAPPAPPAAPTPSAASPPANGVLPGGPQRTSAEQSLFPNSLPIRQTLPGIHSFAPSPAPPSAAPSAASQAGSPPVASPAAAMSPPHTGRSSSAGADQQQKRFGVQGGSGAPAAASPYNGTTTVPPAPPASAPTSAGITAARSTPTPPVIPAASSSAHPAAATPAPVANPASASARSPLPGLTRTPPVPNVGKAAPSQQSQPPAATSSAAGAPNAPARSNPMSVSSMLSGPPRASAVSAYSPHSAAPPASSAATPQPPVLPPESKSTTPVAGASAADRKSPVLPRTQPGSTLPAYASSSVASAKPATPAQPAATTAPATTTGPSAAARSSYPPLPSAFARENPYSPAAPSSAASSSGNTTPQQQQQATAAALKNSLFPNLGAYPGRPGAAQQPAQQPQQHIPPSAATAPYQWQAQAAQQAQQVQAQQQQQQQHFGHARKPSASSVASPAQQPGRPGVTSVSSGPAAPTLGANARPGGALPPSTAAASAAKQPASLSNARYPPVADSYAALRAQGAAPAGVNGQPAAPAVTPSAAAVTASPASASAALKRRRASDAGAEQAHQRVKTGATTTSAPSPPPATPAPTSVAPLFTHAEWRQAMIRPPVIDVLNDAVDAWAQKHAASEGEKRRFLGRVTYDALVPPAKLLDGEVLAQGVGGYVEVVVPTSWILGPHTAPTPASEPLSSSCSVAPVDAHPVALSFGFPSSYAGEPLPFTSPIAPLVLPAHLADLPSLRKRAVWGTDVYTDDSDVLAVLLHSGWLRVTRRERRLRAGERGAGADAIRRARSVGEERIALPPREGEGEGVPKALLVKLGVVPALVRYEGIERQGIRSRSWGNGHDGVSLRVEEVQPFHDVPPPHGLRTRKSRAALCAHQLADCYHDSHDEFDHIDMDYAFPPPPPKRYRFSAPAAPAPTPATANGGSGMNGAAAHEQDAEELVVTDTFVLDLRAGAGGRFVGLERADDEDREDGGEGGSAAMEIEVAA
ncbi:hypothetical protein Rhopal_004813-T1 [Rhodotorula paludigena]|uniref:Rxt3-domain-containing protein n=1 Tax=Rhodotorula paludigena TaxID=86838 RepID=A0AAV5GGV4_9BASI|nr:hypothetical protein Rhopal_004813-T1 [Rhodotorula paludigena]